MLRYLIFQAQQLQDSLQDSGTYQERSGSQSDTGSTSGQQTPPSAASTRTFDRSDAESVSTTISQDSRGSNKENQPTRDLDQEVVLRRKTEYSRVIYSFINTYEYIMYLK